MLKLVEKEDVIVGVDNCDDRDDCGKYRYRDAVEKYVDEWKRKIGESPDGKIVVRIRHIREKVLGVGFEYKSDIAIYTRVKYILFEHSIDVKLYHHYRANLIMMLISYENEMMIISDTERSRESRNKTAKKAGFDNFYDYMKTTDNYKKKRVSCDVDVECTYYLGYHIKNKISKIFDDVVVVKNPISHRHQYIDKESGQWDWKCDNGILIKHLASCHQFMIKTDQFGREHEWSGWHWNILGNKVPNYFLLLGYGDSRENLDIVRGWLVPSKDRIRRKEFWNRESFTIRTDKGSQLMEMSQYEIGHDKIEKIRNIIKGIAPKIVDIDDIYIDIRKQIVEWYKVYFR